MGNWDLNWGGNDLSGVIIFIISIFILFMVCTGIQGMFDIVSIP